MQPEIILTRDGSHSLYVKKLDQHYHSVNGAIQESRHVFIRAGLHHTMAHQTRVAEKIKILEIGLGTGLNALLTFMEIQGSNTSVAYTALEAFPVDGELAGKLNYVTLLTGMDNDKHGAGLNAVFECIHAAGWNIKTALSDNFIIHKMKDTLQTADFIDNYGLVYFDAFSPSVQPEMWTETIFMKLFRSLDKGGCLVTYCAKGEIKRLLKRVGFRVEALPGPPGKREMVRATKQQC